MEENYSFRRELLEVHHPNIRNEAYRPDGNMEGIDRSWIIAIPARCGRVLLNAALDLQQYLLISQNVSVAVVRMEAGEAPPVHSISVMVGGEQGDSASVPGAYRLVCEDGRVTVSGFDERGCAQGCYRIEDQMNEIRAPYLKRGAAVCSPEFSPRMTHSGYGLDLYPDAHLSAIAHAGMDAILVFAKGVDQTPNGYLDFNELIWRAAGYGLDVYAYIYFESGCHPDDAEAFSCYDKTYGELFRRCPGLKGMVLVGESVEFPSKDPRVSKLKYYDNRVEGVYTGKPTAGWFPCSDYHRWVRLLQEVVTRQKPDADIVFWTYNWGYAPEADRLKLIDALPSGISLMVTFEMFETREVDGLRMSTVDYTLSYAGPSAYFVSEAERAKARGIRLYTQANSGGLTWDFGVIPYEPCPMQWAARYEAMLQAKDRYGLCGVMESHHYGFWPSFISRIEKRMFTSPRASSGEALRAEAAALYGAENLELALKAWGYLSEAICYYVSTNEDQYGPFRVGPAYPMVFRSDVQIPTVPYAMFGGNKICFTEYASDALYQITSHTMGSTGMIQQRLPLEIRTLKKMRTFLRKGRSGLEELRNRLTGLQRSDCSRQIRIVRFMENSVTTAIHVKQWNQCKWRIRSEEDGGVLVELMERMIAVGQAEIANAEDTIPLAEADSRLGWEPSMEYIADAAHLRWKIRQTRQVIEEEIPRYIQSVTGRENGN